MTDLLLEMLSHYGMKEVDGPQSNPEIIAMGEDLGFDIMDDSTTAWCSLALNYYAKKCGYEYTGDLAARSWLKVPIVVLKPTMGDVVVPHGRVMLGYLWHGMINTYGCWAAIPII
jgi:hypothetical protein